MKIPWIAHIQHEVSINNVGPKEHHKLEGEKHHTIPHL
jgi:hypothetical protein